MKKRILSILLTLCMVLCLVPTSVFAEDVYEAADEHLRYALDDPAYSVCRLIMSIIISKPLEITREVKLDLNGYALALDGGGSVFVIKDGGHLTVIDSRPDAEYKFTPNSSGLWVWDETDGTETVRGGIIYGGSAERGGGVYIAPGGQFTMNGGSIVGCKANDNGGGVMVDCDETRGSKFTMNGGAIIGCVAKGHGGGVETQANSGNALHGAFIMNSGVIEHCVANKYGGILCSGPFIMNGGTIQYCRATEETDPAEQKGGVFLGGDSQNILNGTIISEDVVDTQYIFVHQPVTIGADADIRANMYSTGHTISLTDGVTSKTIYGKITNGNYADGLAAMTYQVNGADYATQILRSGGTAPQPVAPAIPAGQTFDGWYKADGTKWDFTTAVTENITLAGWLYVPVTNATELTTAMADESVGMIKLTDDIILPTRMSMSIIIRDDRQLILDLNGHVLDQGENPIHVGGGTVGIMTIMDSNPNAPHKFTPDADGLWVWDKGAGTGTETVLGGVITGSTGSSVSAIAVGDSGSKVIMNGGNIVGHKTGGASGGAVHITTGGRFTMNAGSIVGCTAEDGGGVAVGRGTFEMAGGIIKSCKAASDGGAVRVSVKDGTFTMTGGSIEGCTAANGSALCLYGTMNAGGGTVSGTVVLDTKTNNGISSKGIIQGSGSTATRFSSAVTSYGEIGHGIFSGTVTLGNSTLSGTISGGIFNGPVTTASEGEAEISGGVFNKTVTINRGKITNGTFNKDVVVDNAQMSFSCATLIGGTYNGLIINKSAYAAFAGAHSPLGIVGEKPTGVNGHNYCTVTFDLTGGTMEHTTRYFLQGKNISGEIKPDPRTGYIFAGWCKADGTVWEHTNDTVTEDITLYAKWSPRTYTVTFDSTGGSEVTPKTMDVAYGEQLGDMPVPIRTGYFFCGWYDALVDGKCYGNSEGKSTSQYDKTENCTLYAQWKINQYTITFDTAGGSEIAPITQDYSSAITAPANPTRKGYKFTGWDKEIPETMPAENITIKARWEDVEKPTGEIKISENSWKSFLNNITFGLFFKETQTVTITAADNSGEAVTVKYLLSDREMTILELADAIFTEYNGSFSIDPDHEYIIYVLLRDTAGNVAYICSDGIVLDGTAPVIDGIEDGKTYCTAQTVTITEKYVDSVTVNETAVTLDEKGSFILAPADGERTIVVTDKAGNTTQMTVTVNDGHTALADDGDCTTPVYCQICHAEVVAAQQHDFSGEWLTDESGHWHACQNKDCTVTDIKVAHSGTDDGDCTTAVICECGYVLTAAQPAHTWGEWVANGDGTHTRRCTVNACTAGVETEDCADADHDHQCDTCGYVLSECTDADHDHHCDLCGKELSPHTGGKATCTAKAECEVCGEPYGELDAHNHADWRHVEAKAATEEAAGNIEYWYCAACGAYFADEAGAQPITEKDTVITQLEPTKPTATTTKPTVAPSQPQTGDSGHPLLWFALLFVSGGVLTGAAALGKKKKDSVE